MKNIKLSLLFILFFSLTALTQENYILLEEQNNELLIKDNTYSKLSLQNTLAEVDFFSLKIDNVLYSDIQIMDYHHNLEVGAPKLPCLRKLIEIPHNATIAVKINSKAYQEIDLTAMGLSVLVPTQASRNKSDKSPVIFEKNEAIYTSDAWYSPEQCSVEDLGFMRGVRIARLSICPFSYNPVQNKLRVYTDIDIDISFDGADVYSSIYEKKRFYSPFNSLIENNIFNYKALAPSTKDALSKYPIKYVIVSDSSFQTALQPFIEWKTRKGFTVIEAYTNDPLVGNTANSIKAYLQYLYNSATPGDPAPTYLLIVGDVAEVPAFTNNQTGSHVSDLYYCEYTADFFPEMYYGRFSASSVSDINNMVQKTLSYEEFTMSSSSFLDTVVMISGADASWAPTHGNGQINYGTTYYYNSLNNIYSNTYLYPASQTQATQIIQNVNDGCSFVNYTAHGSPSGWVSPAFTVTDVNNLTNSGKYPLMIGNACSTNEFQNANCFGEALLRAPEAGAIGYIGASNSTYWDEDFYWAVGTTTSITANPTYVGTDLGMYDRCFHSHNEAFADWYVSQGQMIYAGNLAVTAMSTSFDYYWEIYHLMGDPSLMVYFGDPQTLFVNHNSVVPTGTSSIQLTTEAYAYIAISQNNNLYGAALADSLGNCTIPLNTSLIPGTIDIVGTKQNRAPYISTIQVITPSGPYVIYENHTLRDSLGNNNAKADYNESISFDVNLKNWGPANASMVEGKLRTTNPYITIRDSTAVWNTVNSNDTARIDNAFSFDIADNIPDQTQIEFSLHLTDASLNTWQSSIFTTANAPSFSIGNLRIDDIASGNGDGILNPGETADIYIYTENLGHADALNSIGTLSSYHPDLSINNSNYNFNSFPLSSDDEAVFNVSLSSAANPSDIVDITYTVSSSSYQATKSYGLFCELAQEDFETGDFSKFDWVFSNNADWFITNTGVYEGSSAAQSGIITHNQKSTMSITLNVLEPDSISFYYTVSSEMGSQYGMWYDYLYFEIDGVIKKRWDGTKPWERQAFYVGSSGNHTFSWTYSKDPSISHGDDCAKVDFITFPPLISDVTTVSTNISEDFTLYPNPATTYTNISFSLEERQDVVVALYDIMGKKVQSNSYTLDAGIQLFQLDLSNLAPGVYTIVMQTEKSSYPQKLIISK